MKNSAIATVVLILAAAGLTGTWLTPDRSSQTVAPPRTTKTEPGHVPDISARLPYRPPNPEPDINQAVLRSETRALLDEVPDDVRMSLVINEPELDGSAAQRVHGMAWIPGGIFVMGNNHGHQDEAPRHAVALDGFWMETTEVTNRQFAEFVDTTGYVTLPERTPELRSLKEGVDLEQFAITEEMDRPGSICSLPLSSRNEIDERGPYSWWQYVPGASWRHPEGPDSSISDRMDHPVVHVSWPDAHKYCRWAGRALPTEAQWEYATRAGHDGRIYPWGNKRQPEGKWLHNIWQGEFPVEDTGEDGFTSTAPVGSFPPSDYGLHDMSGNVWEWCADYYRPHYYRDSPLLNPPGPLDSLDPQEPHIVKRVQRGGSFMCSEQYCIGYCVASRMKGEEDSGAFHTGFRCIVTPEMLKVTPEQ